MTLFGLSAILVLGNEFYSRFRESNERIIAAIDVNAEQRIKLFKKAKQRLITFQGLKVAVLGLAYKPGTDDMREAPSLENIFLLLQAGADMKTALVYDGRNLYHPREMEQIGVEYHSIGR